MTVKYLCKIGSIPSHIEWHLLTDSQDVEALKEHFGNPSELDDFDGFFVQVGDGEYLRVLCFEGIVPNNYKSVYEFFWS